MNNLGKLLEQYKSLGHSEAHKENVDTSKKFLEIAQGKKFEESAPMKVKESFQQKDLEDGGFEPRTIKALKNLYNVLMKNEFFGQDPRLVRSIIDNAAMAGVEDELRDIVKALQLVDKNS